MTKEPTPLQIAKANNEPYVKLVIDQRHCRPAGGRIEVEGPIFPDTLDLAHKLLTAIVAEEDTRAEGAER